MLVALCCSGCDFDKDRDNSNAVGFIEVKSAFEARPGDAFMYGGTLLTPGADRKINSVFKVPAGTDFITLERNAQYYKICELQVRKNRVLSLSLVNAKYGISCDVKR